ncbi:hypothetical protein TNCV_3705481 [Trichonephila clavipes]|nr:hypothetical protein TNCV_3705481 [Trichonephila clavipes]
MICVVKNGVKYLLKSNVVNQDERGVLSRMPEKKKLTLQEALDLFQYLPSEISDLLTDDFSDEEAPANKSAGIFVRFLR